MRHIHLLKYEVFFLFVISAFDVHNVFRKIGTFFFFKYYDINSCLFWNYNLRIGIVI